jgi:hypothetical protein
MKTKHILLFAIVILGMGSAKAQLTNKVGLTAYLQGTQYGISVPIWFNEKWMLAPALQFNYSDNSGTNAGLALAPRYYFKREKIAPYVGIRLGAMMNKPSNGSNTLVDLFGGAAFGGEYFLSNNFSFGVEAQLNGSLSDEASSRFANPGGFNVNVGTMFSATVYF